jgi:hypothetical protein
MLEIFTLKTTTWRIIQGIYSCIRMGGHRQGIFLDGLALIGDARKWPWSGYDCFF